MFFSLENCIAPGAADRGGDAVKQSNVDILSSKFGWTFYPEISSKQDDCPLSRDTELTELAICWPPVQQNEDSPTDSPWTIPESSCCSLRLDLGPNLTQANAAINISAFLRMGKH